MKLDLDHLRIFYEVARAGSLTKAAVHLNISQPALSRAIRIFEERLGVVLFERLARGLKLTLEGERLYEHAYRFVEETTHLVKFLNDKSDEAVGEIKIVTTPAFATLWLPPYLSGFLKLYPNVSVSIAAKTDNLENENTDVMIRPFIPYHPNLIQQHFITFHNKLWASPEYLNLFSTPQKPEDLNNHQLITYGDNVISPYGNNNWILNLGADSKRPRKPYLKMNYLDGLINLAQEGLGIIEVPEEFVRTKNVNLIQVLPELEGPSITIQ